VANIIRSRSRRYVLIHHEVFKFLEREALTCRGRRERGGILIGRYRGPHIEVVSWTEPGATDVSSMTSFVKRDPRHQAAATAAWKNSSSTKTYIGEWHTHPFGRVVPSHIDRQTWKAIAKRNNSRSIFVLVSPIAWGVFLVTSGISSDVLPLARIEDGDIGVVFA
jgi:integrative and conjugative element protein (TIGR02256 family)